MLNNMTKLVYITMFSGYDPSKRFSHQTDKVSRTIQDAIVDIPSLAKQFNYNLADLFNKYNNGLVYESEIGVFVDELNSDELERYNHMLKRQADLEAERVRNDELFEQWKAEKAAEVLKARETPKPVDTPSVSSQSSASE